ncbi:MAG: hypothetical protein HYW77_00950 [Parcubacteria group bacterium]|nr:hypothetical protein [Parcubacteria group bacterium]
MISTEFFSDFFHKKEYFYKNTEEEFYIIQEIFQKNKKAGYTLSNIISVFDKIDKRLSQLLSSLIDRLRHFAEINSVRVEIKNDVAGFASYVGDTIFISTRFASLIGEANIDSLAAVLAHEIAHMENCFRSYTTSKAYNHAEEYRADSRGLAIMIQAGFNPHGMVDLFRLLEKLDGDEESLTHPFPSKRAVRIEAELEAHRPGNSKYYPYSFNHAYVV